MTVDTGVPIGIGTMILVHGQSYIVLKVQASEDYQMKTMTLTALDPFSAQQERGRIQAKREEHERLARMLPKMEKMVNEASQ